MILEGSGETPLATGTQFKSDSVLMEISLLRFQN